MKQPKELNQSRGKFFEFIFFHLTPAGWHLKRLAKAGYLEFRRDKETGRVYVHPTKKTAELMAMRGVESCLACIEKPLVKSIRHHNFLTEIGLKFWKSGYSDFRINPMCLHRPERNLGADAALTMGQARLAIMLETKDTRALPLKAHTRNFDGILIFVEDVDIARYVVDCSAGEQKACFLGLTEFLKRGMKAKIAAVNRVAGETVEDFLCFIQTIADSKN